MKKLIVIFCLFAAFSTFSQEAVRNAEVMPEYPGGPEAMMKFIRSNLKPISEIPKDSGYSTGCKTLIDFTIDVEGSVKNVFVVRSCINCSACDGEALRAIEKMPKWKPGMQNNKPVAVSMSLPIFFTLK